MNTTTTRRQNGGAEQFENRAGGVAAMHRATQPRHGVGVRRRRAVRRAFSLIEVMIVIAIILAISGLVALTLFSRRDQAEAQLGRVEFRSLQAALRYFRLDYNRYPTDEEGVAVLWDKERLDPEADQTIWHEYVEAPIPKDRWGSEWGYRQQSEETEDTTKYDLWSFGPDKEEGTEDDIQSWTVAGAEDEQGGNLPPPSGSGN